MLARVPWVLWVSCLVVSACGPASDRSAPPEGWPDGPTLWQAWDDERFVSTAAACLRHEELVDRLESLHQRFADSSELEAVGLSYEGRPIHLLTLGRGPTEVLLWSQMHGDEPSATPALLDVAHYLLNHAEEPMPAAILEQLTLRLVPMLNPDGSEQYRRRNAQGIDINRDALNLATPEGRLLKELRDRFQPMLGFNLHDQNRRTGVGDTRGLATAAVLAVAGDEANTLTPGRERAMRASSAIVDTLEPYLPGGIARYDEDWSPRAFGDNITAWGTPVVLVESGGIPQGEDVSILSRLNFVALLRVLSELVHNDLESFDETIYRDLPRNRSEGWVDVMVRGGLVLQGLGEPYRADVAFNVQRPERVIDAEGGCSVEGAVSGSAIEEIGDTRFLGTARVIDASDTLLVSAFSVGVEGWGAEPDLDEESLERLARWGVATLHWQVSEARYFDAMEVAGRFASPQRPRIVVTTEPLGAVPTVDLKQIALEPPALLRERVGVLLAGEMAEAVEERTLRRRLVRLWQRRGWQTLRPGAEASFLLLSIPEAESEVVADRTLDLEGVTVRSIWLNGSKME